MPPITLFRYIALRTLVGIGGLYLVLASLILLIDLVENMRFASKFADGDFGFAVALTLMRVPALVQALTPFVFLFGSLWMFGQLNRRSEVAVMRSAGLSIWRLLGPAALIATVFGSLLIAAFDPLAANLLAYSEQVKAEREGKNQNLVRIFDDGIWFRQRDGGKQLIVNADSIDEASGVLRGVTAWRFGPQRQFIERIDSPEAVLSGNTMELKDARLTTSANPEGLETALYAIATAITARDLSERVTPPETMSLWQLPRFILLAEAAGLPTVRYQIRFHDLCSTPLKLLAMVLIAAAFSLRPTRLGGALGLLVMSIAAGFSLYIVSEISTALGESGLAPVSLAAWTPALLATIIAVTALLHLEDG